MIKQIIAPMNDPQQQGRLIRKACLFCQQEFETNVLARIYCSNACQRKAKIARQRTRSLPSGAATIFELERRSDCDYVKDPTEKTILSMAEEFKAGRERPVIFYGNVVVVAENRIAPITFRQQEDGSWLML
jgi:hypothetical protein